jgi:hypothetical protein
MIPPWLEMMVEDKDHREGGDDKEHPGLRPRPNLIEAAMRICVAALVLIGLLSPASAATYTIQNWPQDLSKVPCDAWKHNSDGTWVEVGTIIVNGNATTGMTFKDTDEAKLLDAKCPHKNNSLWPF